HPLAEGRRVRLLVTLEPKQLGPERLEHRVVGRSRPPPGELEDHRHADGAGDEGDQQSHGRRPYGSLGTPCTSPCETPPGSLMAWPASTTSTSPRPASGPPGRTSRPRSRCSPPSSRTPSAATPR